jgi:hypothetical protein
MSTIFSGVSKQAVEMKGQDKDPEKEGEDEK